MHARRQSNSNSLLHRKRSLEARQPILGLPSLPIVDPLLGPILTPLLGGGGGGGGGGQQQPTTTQQQPQQPPPTTTAPPSSPPQTTAAPPSSPQNTGNGNGNGNSGNGSGSGSGSGGSNSGGGGGSSQPTASPGSGSGSGSGNGNGNGSGSGTGSGNGSTGSGNGNSTGPGNGSTNGSGSGNAGDSNNAGGGGGANPGSGSGNNNTNNNNGTGNGQGSSSSRDGTGSNSGASGSQNPNAGVLIVGQPSSSSAVPAGVAVTGGQGASPTALSSGGSLGGSGSSGTTPGSGSGSGIGTGNTGGGGRDVGGAGGGSGGGGGGGGNGGTPGETGATTNSPNNKLAPGAIAGIVIGCLVALLLIAAFIRRRRLIQTRLRRRNQWAGTAIDSRSYDFGDVNSPDLTVNSARSSFATTYDHSFPSHIYHEDTTTSPVLVPQMAELRDTHVTGTHNQRFSTPRSPPPPILVHIETMNDSVSLARQDSTGSVRSITSDPYSQGQVVYLPNQDPNNLSATTPMSVRPFSPSEAFSFPKPPTSVTTISTGGGSTRESWESARMSAYNAGGDTVTASPRDPFADSPTSISRSASDARFSSSMQVIKRPFHPNRDDELEVAAGDRVSIIQTFDDGWVAVRKHEDVEGKGKGKAASAPGLIPVDCFREQGQPLPEFLEVNRVAGYGV